MIINRKQRLLTCKREGELNDKNCYLSINPRASSHLMGHNKIAEIQATQKALGNVKRAGLHPTLKTKVDLTRKRYNNFKLSIEKVDRISADGEVRRHEAELIASTIVRQAKKGLKVDQTMVDTLKENLFDFFQVSRKNHRIRAKNELEVVTTKTENQRYINKMRRLDRRRQMGLPQKMLGDTLEFGERKLEDAPPETSKFSPKEVLQKQEAGKAHQ